MTREEYVDFDFDVAYYNLACVCWRLEDDAGCQAALTVCLYLEIASEFEDGEEAKAYSQQVGLMAAGASAPGPEGVSGGGSSKADRASLEAYRKEKLEPTRMNELSALMSLVLQIRGAGAPGVLSPAGAPLLPADAAVPSLALPPVPVSIHTSRLYQDVRNDSELAGIEHKSWFAAMFSQ